MTEPASQSLCSFVITELFRRQRLSAGKAAKLLGLPLPAFHQYPRDVGIPYMTLADDDWAAERAVLERLRMRQPSSPISGSGVHYP